MAALVDLCSLLLLSALTGYVAEHSRAMGAAGAVLTIVALVRAFLSLDDPRCRRAKLIVLSLLSALLPVLAAAITQSATPSSPLAPEDNEGGHRTISSMLLATFAACAKLWTSLLWSARNELPSVLVSSLAALTAVGGVGGTAWLLHEGSDVGAVRSGLAATATVMVLAIGALLVGLRGCRERLNHPVLLLCSLLLFVVCAGGAAAAHWLVAESGDELLRLLQPLSAVATVAAALLALGASFLFNEKRALSRGYSSHAASTTAVARVLVKIFTLLFLLSSALFGLTIDSPSLPHAAAFAALMTSMAVVQGSLGYMRYKEPALVPRSCDVRSILMCVLAAGTVLGEIALLILCHLHWRALSPQLLAGLCLALHTTHLATGWMVDRLRGVLRPLALPAGLLLLAVFSSSTLYGELTQFFPGQSRSPTVWLAASLAAAAAAQLLAIPTVECFKREAADEKTHRKEMQAAFRAETKQRLQQKRTAEELRRKRSGEGEGVAPTASGRLRAGSNGCCIGRTKDEEEVVEMVELQ